jgi:hypothetical protein
MNADKILDNLNESLLVKNKETITEIIRRIIKEERDQFDPAQPLSNKNAEMSARRQRSRWKNFAKMIDQSDIDGTEKFGNDYVRKLQLDILDIKSKNKIWSNDPGPRKYFERLMELAQIDDQKREYLRKIFDKAKGWSF